MSCAVGELEEERAHVHIKGLTPVGTRTDTWTEMAQFVRQGRSLAPVDADSVEPKDTALPDRAGFAAASSWAYVPHGTGGLLVDDLVQASQGVTD